MGRSGTAFLLNRICGDIIKIKILMNLLKILYYQDVLVNLSKRSHHNFDVYYNGWSPNLRST